MEIKESLIFGANRPAPGIINRVRYITIHETGNSGAGADAIAHAQYLQNEEAVKAKVSWHYTVDDKIAVRHIPDGESAWHCGTANGNKQSIGIEICVNEDGNFEGALKNAAELVNFLLLKHNLSIDKVVQHNFWNGKNCPQQIRDGGRWDEFIALAGGYGMAEKYSYFFENGIHRLVIPIKAFNIKVWDAPKKTSKIKNYFNAGYFAPLSDGTTYPVGNLAANGQVMSQCKSAPSWINLSGKSVSTLLVTESGAQISITDHIDDIDGLRCAVCGVPVLLSGREVSLSKDIRPQGWLGSELYATWHGFITVKGSNIIYLAFKTTAKSAAATTTEIFKKLKPYGFGDVIKLDGGGSFVVDVEGKNVAVTAENRRVHNLATYG